MEPTLGPAPSGRGAARLLEPLDRARRVLEPPEPAPLQLDAGPDPLGNPLGEARRCRLDARVPQRRAKADAHLHRPDAPPPARSIGPRNGDGHDGRTGLEDEAAYTALGPAELVGLPD